MMKFRTLIVLFVLPLVLILGLHRSVGAIPKPPELGVGGGSPVTYSNTIESQLAQANAYQRQGLYRRSRKQLEALSQDLFQAPDSEIKVKGLLQLANILSFTGEENSQSLLDQAMTIAHTIDPKNAIGLTALTHFHQGNFYLFNNQNVKAQDQYNQALEEQPNPTLRLTIQVRSLSLRFNTPNSKREDLVTPWQQLLNQVQQSPLNNTTLYLRLELAELALHHSTILSTSVRQRLLIESLQLANSLNDRQASTAILGQLGQIHLQSGRLELADRNVNQALKMAQRSNNSNLIYRNFHLLGQIEVRRNHLEQAKQYYQSAIDTLQQIRYDLVATSPNLQFEFREEVEPIYRELVDLLLTPTTQNIIPQSQLKQAQTVMDSLRDAELVNYFREACWDVLPQAIEQLDPTAAVIYPIVLSDRLEVLWNLPGQPLQHYTIPVSQSTVETRVTQMRQALRSTSLSAERLPLEQELYNWLIRPALSQIQSNPAIKTLVFNPDTAFQLFPMNVLHDGKQYLIEQYAIATTPGLKLRPSQSLSSIDWKGTRSFVGGISDAQGESPALPGVMEELDAIDRQIQSKPHRNGNLNLTKIKNALAKTPIALLHLATHGQFSATPGDTFLQLWGDRLTVKDLGMLFEERTINGLPPLELLILSACQTAQGDRRAALGIAGIAIQSGARSTIASLWTVDDRSTAELMDHLYQNLDKNLPRAEALRQAQLRILKNPEYRHPYYWSAFTLLGAWG